MSISDSRRVHPGDHYLILHRVLSQFVGDGDASAAIELLVDGLGPDGGCDSSTLAALFNGTAAAVDQLSRTGIPTTPAALVKIVAEETGMQEAEISAIKDPALWLELASAVTRGEPATLTEIVTAVAPREEAWDEVHFADAVVMVGLVFLGLGCRVERLRQVLQP